MRVNGSWRACDDGVARPTFIADVKDATGQWVEIFFLADCGADRTVISPDVFTALAFPMVLGDDAIAGIGGLTESFEFESVLRMKRNDGVAIQFRGRFAAAKSPSILDMSVLGRDITNHLALVIDHPGDNVCLLYPGDVYQA